MKKKVTNDDVAKFIKECAEKVDSELDLEYRVAYCNMLRSEQELVATYTEEQNKLYKNFLDDRQKFYDLHAIKSKINK